MAELLTAMYWPGPGFGDHEHDVVRQLPRRAGENLVLRALGVTLDGVERQLTFVQRLIQGDRRDHRRISGTTGVHVPPLEVRGSFHVRWMDARSASRARQRDLPDLGPQCTLDDRRP